MLSNLVKTLETCKEHHENNGDEIKARVVQEHIDKASNSSLSSKLNSYNSLYNEEGQ